MADDQRIGPVGQGGHSARNNVARSTMEAAGSSIAGHQISSIREKSWPGHAVASTLRGVPTSQAKPNAPDDRVDDHRHLQLARERLRGLQRTRVGRGDDPA